MTVTRTNALIAAGIAVVNSLFPFLVLIGALSWDADQIAGAYLVISNLGTFIGLLFASSPVTNTPDA